MIVKQSNVDYQYQADVRQYEYDCRKRLLAGGNKHDCRKRLLAGR